MVRAACTCPTGLASGSCSTRSGLLATRSALIPSARARPVPPHPPGPPAPPPLPPCGGRDALVRSGSSNLQQPPPLFDADRHHLHGVTLFPQRLAPLEVELPAV